MYIIKRLMSRRMNSAYFTCLLLYCLMLLPLLVITGSPRVSHARFSFSFYIAAEFTLSCFVLTAVLRHEEFSEGCEAACNGPYANRWSKTMIGYGPEDNHFVVELTYNYGITQYEQGNDFLGLTIQSSESLKRAASANWPVKEHNGLKYLEAPGGYKFYIIDKPQPVDKDPVVKVSLASSNLAKSIAYWNGLLSLKIFEKTGKSVTLGFSEDQAKLELVDIGGPVNHAKAYGRIAFSCPFDQQPIIDKNMQEAKEKILTPLISLDTPGKATVRVIILADPDDHEICFVDDESFRQLSQVDPASDADLDKFIKSDKSRASRA